MKTHAKMHGLKQFLCGLTVLATTALMMPMTAMAAGDETYEAKIDETNYMTLAEAFEGAEEGDTITLLKDVSNVAITIQTDNLILDLDDHELSGQKHDDTITPAALTIERNIDQLDKFTVQNGTISTGTGINAHQELKELVVSNVTFENNSATQALQKEGGAAVKFEVGVNSTLAGTSATFTNCNFVNNSTYYENGGDPSGGAVALDCIEKVKFENCKFESNKSTGTSAPNAHNGVGGAVNADYCGMLEFKKCSFVGNNADSASGGGAIHTMYCGNTSITGCIFSSNTASNGAGGAIALTYSTGKSIIEDSTFTNNTAYSGGALWICKDNVIMDGNTFSNNSATNGGIMMIQDISNVTFNDDVSNGNAAGVGGFVYITGDSDLTVNGNISNNTAGRSGGAIYAAWSYCYASGQYVGIPDVVINGDLIGNISDTYGGAIYANIANVTVKGAIQDNTASYGGAVYNNNGSYQSFPSTIDLSNAAVYNNNAESAGDDLYNYFNADNSSAGRVILPSVGSDWILSSCSHLIDGWYDDSANSRWNGDSEPIHAEKVEVGTITGFAALKAAHGANPTEVPTVVKTSGDSDSITSAEAGELVPFTLKINVPKYTRTLTIVDTMTNMSLDDSNVYVTMNGSVQSVPVNVTDTGFTLTLDNLFSNSDKTITVTYNARVNKDVEAGDPVSNTASINGGGSDTICGTVYVDGADEDRGDPYLKINKLWVGDDEEIRPESVKVNVYHEDDFYRTVTIYEKYEWMGGTFIPARWEDDVWWVEEADVPEEYDSEVEQVRHLVFNVTNTLDEDVQGETD